jgi:hypothetical protein
VHPPARLVCRRTWHRQAQPIAAGTRHAFSDEFVEQIRRARGARKPLSAAGVQAVREEYANTVRPMQAALREAERLERRLSDLVNQAYGLTPDEIRLMWDTAPPRMPLTPAADQRPQADAPDAEAPPDAEGEAAE